MPIFRLRRDGRYDINIDSTLNELRECLNVLSKMLRKGKSIAIRDSFPLVSCVIDSRMEEYVDLAVYPFVNKLIDAQIRRGIGYKVYYGKYSEIEKYAPADDDYLLVHEGGFPTKLSKDSLYINGYSPDIDSTSLATIVLSKYMINYGEEREYVSALKLALDYLSKRDYNNDGLLEQGVNEDWCVGAYRAGSVFYSNIIYCLALETSLTLLRKLNDSYYTIVKARLNKLRSAVLDGLWLGDYFANLIDPHGKYGLEYSLDTIYICLSDSMMKYRRAVKHINTLYNKLMVNGLLINFYPPSFNEHVSKYAEYTSFNGGAWINLNILFARALVKIGMVPDGLSLIRNITPYRSYEWVNPRNTHVKGKKVIYNSALLYETIAELNELGVLKNG